MFFPIYQSENFFFICFLDDLVIAKSYAVPTSESGKVIYRWFSSIIGLRAIV
jgi:hypothetical protein